MILRDYIMKIHEITKLNNLDIVIDLFNAAGSDIFSGESAKKWMLPKENKAQRNCQIKRYFNDTHPFNEDGFIKYLRNQIRTSWKKLQEAFASIHDDNIIDTATDNESLFYWSLLNQFQKIHHLPLSPIPTDFQKNNDGSFDDSQNNKKHFSIFETLENQYTYDSKNANIQENNFSESNKEFYNSFQPEHMYDEFKVSFDSYPVAVFLDRTPGNLYHSHLIRDAFEFANHIRYIYEHEGSFDKDIETYKKIIDANNCLYEYLAFLQDNSFDAQNFLDNFEVKNDVGANFFEKAEKYCKQLKAMYQEINKKIEKIKIEEHNQAKDVITKEHESVRYWRLRDSLDEFKK